MAIQRAIVRGNLADLVQMRNMFTASVVATGGDTADMLWDTYIGSILSPLVPLFPPGVSFTSREIQELNQGVWQTIFDDPISYVGTKLNFNQMPNAVAFVFIAKTIVQRVVGRKFFSGLTEDSVNENVISVGSVAAIAQSFAAYIGPWTTIAGSTFSPGVVDKSGVFHPFVGGFVSSFIGSMRRRKPGVGM